MIKLNIKENIERELSREYPECLARKYEVIIIREEGQGLEVAMVNPNNRLIIQNIRIYFGKDIRAREISKEEYDDLFEYIYLNKKEGVKLDKVNDLLESILNESVKLLSTDIHIESGRDSIRIRYRINGKLKEVKRLEYGIYDNLITKIKIISGLDIAEKRFPQDGRFSREISNRYIDFRVSTFPTVNREKLVIRILDRDKREFTKEGLGFDRDIYQKFDELISIPSGLILITGPAGSGKTTTMYSILNEFNREDKNIMTIEDPVEYKFDGMNQSQVNIKGYYKFEDGLESILRQDPDIIMIGEIRNDKVAHLAMKAAVTGHLVLSTLHTEDSISSIFRMDSLNINRDILSSGLKGVISQRLIRVLCNDCKIGYEASRNVKILMGLETDVKLNLYKAQGCECCNDGYVGMKAILEVLKIDENIRKEISEGGTLDSLGKTVKNSGMKTLRESIRDNLVDGLISLEDVYELLV